MKRKILNIALASGLVLSSSAAFAGGVGYVNVQDVFEASPLGKAKVTADEKKLKPKMNELKSTITNLQETINSYEDKKDSKEVKAADKKKARSDLKKAMKEYQALMDKVQKMASDDSDAFKEALNKAASEVAKDKDLDSILPGEMSVYNVESADVTKDITEKMS